MCYCNAADDDSLSGVASSTYAVTPSKQCGSTPDMEAAYDYVTFAVSNLTDAYKDHLCTVKCARGCVGQDCFCDAFDPETMYVSDKAADLGQTKSYALCLSVTGCRDACTAHGECTGFDYDPERNLCWLVSAADEAACPSGAYKEGWELWFRDEGAACQDLSDYSSQVGKVTITNRVDIGNNWIWTPGEVQSFDVTGDDLSWKTDRILSIDCTGICGVSSPPPQWDLSMFNNWVPVGPGFIDPPHDDDEGGYVAPDDTEDKDVLWRKSGGRYCPGNNMDIAQVGTADASRHQCYNKCVTNAPCAGDDCNCDGLLQGYDGPDSQALCLP